MSSCVCTTKPLEMTPLPLPLPKRIFHFCFSQISWATCTLAKCVWECICDVFKEIARLNLFISVCLRSVLVNPLYLNRKSPPAFPLSRNLLLNQDSNVFSHNGRTENLQEIQNRPTSKTWPNPRPKERRAWPRGDNTPEAAFIWIHSIQNISF